MNKSSNVHILCIHSLESTLLFRLNFFRVPFFYLYNAINRTRDIGSHFLHIFLYVLSFFATDNAFNPFIYIQFFFLFLKNYNTDNFIMKRERARARAPVKDKRVDPLKSKETMKTKSGEAEEAKLLDMIKSVKG